MPAVALVAHAQEVVARIVVKLAERAEASIEHLLAGDANRMVSQAGYAVADATALLALAIAANAAGIEQIDAAGRA